MSGSLNSVTPCAIPALRQELEISGESAEGFSVSGDLRADRRQSPGERRAGAGQDDPTAAGGARGVPPRGIRALEATGFRRARDPHAGFDRGEGSGRGRRERQHRQRVLQSVGRALTSSPKRCSRPIPPQLTAAGSRHERAPSCTGFSGRVTPAMLRDEANPLQHLPPPRPAARPHRQSRQNRRSSRCSSQQRPTICSSWPAETAATSSVAPSTSTIARSKSIAEAVLGGLALPI